MKQEALPEMLETHESLHKHQKACIILFYIEVKLKCGKDGLQIFIKAAPTAHLPRNLKFGSHVVVMCRMSRLKKRVSWCHDLKQLTSKLRSF